MEARRILVTGSAGVIGQAVCTELKARGHFVRGLDLHSSGGADETLSGSMTDAEKVQGAANGMDVVIHLAAIPHDADFISRLLPNNIIAVYNVLEAARIAKVKRLVLASSVQTVWGNEEPWPITVEMLPHPRNLYAASKLFLEHAGEAYAHQHNLSVIAVRPGWCPRDKKAATEIAASEFHKDQYLSPVDAGRFFACAAETQSEIRFAVLFATSRPILHTRYGLGSAKALIGYEPIHTFPQGTENLK